LLKKTRTPKSGKHVKFDASAIRSEGHALRRYANAKMKEYNEGRWLRKLNELFKENNDKEFNKELSRWQFK